VLCCRRGALALVVVAGGLAFAATGAPGQSPPPACAAGVVAHPVLGAHGYPEGESGDARLFATHPITLTAGFPSDGPPTNADVVIAIPPGFVRSSDELSAGGAIAPQFSGELVSTVVLGDQPGALPLTATWTQSDGTDQGVCAGSATTSASTRAARAARACASLGAASATADSSAARSPGSPGAELGDQARRSAPTLTVGVPRSLDRSSDAPPSIHVARYPYSRNVAVRERSCSVGVGGHPL
jgi:hypothetical protein